MNLTKGPADFKLPPETEEPWNRLLHKGGTRSDLKSVLSFLAKLWAFDESDPRGFDEWLSSHGVPTGVSKGYPPPPPAIMAEYKERFGREKKAKVAPTRDLLEALTVGPHSSEFFTSFAGFSSELKILAYRTAIAAYRNEGIVFALSALSQENRWIVEEATKGVPDSPCLEMFSSYLKGARLPLSFAEGPIGAAHQSRFPIDHLFRISTVPFKEMVNAAGGASLVQLAELLFQQLPDRSFGQFIKLNIAVFVCIVAPESKSMDLAKRALIATGEPSVADVLAMMGKDQLLSELRNARQVQLPGRERLLAAMIDGWRRVSAEAPDQLQEEIQPFVSAKSTVVALAARASVPQQTPKDRNRFEAFLLRSLQQDKEGWVREWLLRNSEFANHLRTDKASIQVLRSLLETYRIKMPARALQVIAQVLGRRSGKEPQRNWNEAIRALATIGGDEADRIFSSFLLERIERGEGPQIRDFVARDPTLSLLRKSFWSLLERTTNEREWEALFDIYCSRTTESEVVRLLEVAHERNARLAGWMSKQLIPRLLANEFLSLGFHRLIANRGAIAMIAKDLTRDTLADYKYIHLFADNWATTRATAKQKLLFRIRTGLRIALQNSVSGGSIYTQLSKAVRAVEDWGTADSPKLDPSIRSLASGPLPYDIAPSSENLQQVFRGAAPGSKDFALIAGMNPWVLDLVLQPEPGPWPKPDLLLDQITTRFVYIARLKKRAQEVLHDLGQTVRIEVAMALRDVLSDIESELAGYFVLRDMLDKGGLHPVMAKLGEVVDQKDLSSEKHKVSRDSERRGRLRVFGLGIRVDDRTIGSGLIMNSGDNDDRD